MGEHISEDVVVLVKREKSFRPLKLKKGRKLHLDKLSFYADGALGHNYGNSFEVHKQQLVPLRIQERKGPTVLVGGDHVTGPDDQVTGAGNRNIYDDGSSQELTEQDISVMKGQGASGQEIVESMIEHSSSFKERSKFSQEKYIRKKEKKYIPVIKISRTTTKLLCDHYHERAPAKICHMRSDTLAQILTLSNVHAHSNVVVMETCQGLVVGSMLERMGGYGKLVQVFYGDFPVRTILDNFGHLTEADRAILMKYPLHRLGQHLLTKDDHCTSSVLKDLLMSNEREALCQDSTSEAVVQESEGKSSQVEESMESSPPPAKKLKIEHDEPQTELKGEHSIVHEQSNQQQHDEESDTHTQQIKPSTPECEDDRDPHHSQSEGCEPITEDSTTVESASGVAAMETGSLSESIPGRKERKLVKEEAYKEAELLLQQRQMDGLVIACRFLPEPILMTLVNFVAPSRPIVVYCHLLEPLVQCYKSLKESGMTFNIQITETWTRHYQVLPERTHPAMIMDGHSGYILTATKIARCIQSTD